jgi:hypothetical protein
MSAELKLPRLQAQWVLWLFALIGLAGLLGLLALIGIAFFDFRGNYEPPKVAGNKPEEVFTVGSAESLSGTNLVQMDVDVLGGRGGSGPYSGGPGQDTRNILLVDKATGASRRILSDNSRRIDETHFLTPDQELTHAGENGLIESGSDPKKLPVAYYVLSVAAPGEGKGEDVLVGTLASGRQDWVMRGVDGIDSLWMQSPTQLGLIVREHLGLYYRIVDIPTLKVVQSKRIEIG